MKINIGYKFQKNKIFNLKLLSIFLLLIILCELYFMKISSEDNEVNKNEMIINNLSKEEQNEKSIDNIRREVISKKLEVKSINKEGESYLIEANITGYKEEFLQKIKDLKNFSIKDYKFFVEKDSVTGKITINYSC